MRFSHPRVPPPPPRRRALANSFCLVFLCHPFYLHSVQPFQISRKTGSNYRAIYKLRGKGEYVTTSWNSYNTDLFFPERISLNAMCRNVQSSALRSSGKLLKLIAIIEICGLTFYTRRLFFFGTRRQNVTAEIFRDFL